MIKMTFMLAVALYAGFVIWGAPPEDIANARGPDDVTVPFTTVEFDAPVIITGEGRDGSAVTRAAVVDILVPDAAAIAAATPPPDNMRNAPRRIGEPVTISLMPPEAPSSTATDAIAAAPEVENLFVVSGSRVNMRSGPSTTNSVVDSLPGGSMAEIIGEELGGWVRIRDVSTGLTGYMAARFLEPA